MSSTFNFLSQVPVLAWLFCLAALFGGLWKVFNTLYVKPRDFEIECLKREIESLKTSSNEPRSSRRDEEHTVEAAEIDAHKPTRASPKVPSLERQIEDANGTLAEGLRSLDFALKRIRDDSLTKLQLESVHEYFIEKNVVWRGTIGSVSKSSAGSIIVQLKHADDSYDNAYAEFDGEQKAELLRLKKGDCVVVSGQVEKIFLGSPWLQRCSIALAE